MTYTNDKTQHTIERAVRACLNKLDELAPEQYERGPINTTLALKLETTIKKHLETYQRED